MEELFQICFICYLCFLSTLPLMGDSTRPSMGEHGVETC